MATKHANLYIDTIACTTRRYLCELADYLCHRGRERVFFSTNYPIVIARQALEQFSEPGLNDEATKFFPSKIARRAFCL
ncbi:hypothetical protein [Streptomyces sp. NPDC102487]|uniref:hypothetical protein n=1 Tax=Streptomyces sp. NPDC102487 TaxID=3366182 RepID=UPI00382E0A33